MENKIKEIILNLGADVCGIANIDRFSEAPAGFHPRDILPDCKSVIVFGIALPKGLTKVEPRLIYGHFNYSTCPEVDWVAFRAAKEIERLCGGYAVPLPSDSPYEYWDAEKLEGRGLISMKHERRSGDLHGHVCLPGHHSTLYRQSFGAARQRGGFCLHDRAYC